MENGKTRNKAHPRRLGKAAREKARTALRRALTATMALVLALGNVLGMFAPAAAHADDGYSYTFENGGTVWVSADGDTITGTCRLTGGHIDWSVSDGSWGAYRSTAVMPDGASLPAACYESYIGKPDHALYPGPCDGSYSFTATRQGSGDYFVLVHSQDAAGGAPETNPVPPGYTYQRVYAQRWTPDIKVTVNFTKISADATVTDGNSEYAYAGATYDIYDASTNQKVDTITTNGSGHASLALKPNYPYYAIETKAPQGFVLNTNRIYFTTGNSTSSEKLADDPGYVMLTVAKKDSATLGDAQPGATLEGAEFKCVSLSTPGWEATASTDESGSLRFIGVPLGKIVVTETKAPTGYKLDPTPHEYEVKANQITNAGVFELEPEDDFKENVVAFDLTIAKTKGGEDSSWDEDDGQADPAAGVQFQIVSNSTGEVVGTLTTNERGFASTDDPATVNPEAVSEDATHDASKPWMGEGKRNEGISGALPYDEAGYTVREVPETVPEGFDHVDDWQLAAEQMADGANLQFSVIDKTLNSKIQIVKTDEETGNAVPLAGFSFNVLDEGGKKVSMTEADVDTFTTDESGMVTLPERLPSGSYSIREVAAQAPYLLAGEDVEFSVSGDYEDTSPVTVVKVSDKQAHGIARIHKACSEDGCAYGEGGLAGAEFDVIAMENVVSPDGTVQAVEGETVDHVVTEEGGGAQTKLLPLGSGTARYAFVETKAPAGHVLDATPIEFTLSWADDETEVVYADAEAVNEPTETVVDKTVLGTGDPLEGAEFDLWPDFLEADASTEDAATGALSLRFDGLLGTGGALEGVNVSLSQTFGYALLSVEVPEGYGFSVEGGNGNGVSFSEGSAAVAPGTYALSVTDDEGNAIDLGDAAAIEAEAGMSYAASYSKGVLGWGAGLAVDESEIEPARYDEGDFSIDGDIATVEGVAPGTYELSVSGFGEDASCELAVADGARSFASVSREDGLALESHMLRPYMQAALDAVLDGFGVELVTDGNGQIDIKHLPARCEELADAMKAALADAGFEDPDALFEGIDTAGSIAWRVQEAKAPAGFVVDDGIRDFTIHDDGMTEGEKTHHVGVEDDYTKVEISKRDIANEAEVEGAKLTVSDSEGNVVASWTSTKEPHRIDALAPGDYTLTEEMTPNNYDKAQSVEFTVLETGEIQTVVMYDEPIEVTGELDKRQEIADPTAEDTEENGDLQNKADVTVSEKGFYDYSLDYRNTSSTWVDEFTVEDSLDAVGDGVAELVGVTTAQGWQDYDGLMNVWYKTDQTPADYVDESGANATLGDGHENPWLAHESNAERLGDDGRVTDYTGWRLWAADVSTTEARELAVADLGLAEGEKVTAVRFEYGRVEEGFTTRADEWDRDNLKSGHDDLDDVQATHKGGGFELPARNIVEIKDGDGSVLEVRYMSDDELEAASDGAGYTVDCNGVPTFVPAEDVHRVEAEEAAYAPAILHMQVTDAYTEGAQLDNSATLDLYRNGGGADLEDHDKDFVTQVPKTVVHETPATPTEDLDQTGGNLLAVAGVAACAALAAGGAYACRRRNAKLAEAAAGGSGSGPDGGPDDGAGGASADAEEAAEPAPNADADGGAHDAPEPDADDGATAGGTPEASEADGDQH